jgi:uncharacterized membrane protein YgcG
MKWSQFGARLCIALAVLIMAGCAAQPPRGGPGGPRRMPMAAGGKMARPAALLFVGMDADRDLVVTTAELTDGLAVEWKRADRDGNGALSAFEMADWCAAVLGDADAAPGRLSLDADVDGQVTHAEFDAGIRREFAAFDRNGDGRLERAELLTAAGGRPGGGDGGGADGGRGGGPGGGPGGGGGGGGGRHRPY